MSSSSDPHSEQEKPDHIEWVFYAGESLHAPGIAPVIMKFDPSVGEELSRVNHEAWQAVISALVLVTEEGNDALSAD